MDPRQTNNMNHSSPLPEGYMSLAHYYYYAQYLWAYRQLYDQQYYQRYPINYTLSLPTSEPLPEQNTNYHCEALDFSRSQSRENPESQSLIVESNENNPSCVNPTQSIPETPMTNDETPSSTNENDPEDSQEEIQNSGNACSDMNESQDDFQVVSLGQKKIKLRIVAGTNEYYAKKREEKLRFKTLETLRQKKMDDLNKSTIPHVAFNTTNNEYVCKFNLCGFTANRLPFVAKHVQAMHGPDFIVCCSKLYPTKGHFEAHRAVLHSNGLFRCQISGCKKSYVKRHFLNKHQDVVHGWKGTLLCSACSAILPHPSVNEGLVKEHALRHSATIQQS